MVSEDDDDDDEQKGEIFFLLLAPKLLVTCYTLPFKCVDMSPRTDAQQHLGATRAQHTFTTYNTRSRIPSRQRIRHRLRLVAPHANLFGAIPFRGDLLSSR